MAIISNMAANPPPRKNNVINLSRFQGRLGTNHDIHSRKFQIACVAISVPIDKTLDVFAATS